jgi:arylsulfatase A-like enzyme
MRAMTRRVVCCAAAVAAGCIVFGRCGVVSAADTQPAARPNIVLCLADDLGYGQLGYEGNREAKTPRLDALAAEGVRLTHCYAAHSLCAPSRTAIMTGRNSYRCGGTGGLGGQLSPAETTLPRVLRDHGYRTGHFGKWHQWAKPGDPQFGLTEYLYTGNNASHVNPGYDGEFDGTTTRRPGKIEGDDSEILVRRCLEFVDRAVEQNQPFFANIWFHTVHDPNGSAQRFRDLYPGNSKAAYLSDLSAMDAAVGLLLDELAGRKLDRNTLLVFTSDNGFGRAADPAWCIAANDRNRDVVSNKGGMGENAVRVPGLVRWPARFPAARSVGVPIVGTDWMPTFLAAASVAGAGHRPWDGVDVLPVLDGQAKQRPAIGFWAQPSNGFPPTGAPGGTLYLIDGIHRLWRGADGQELLYALDGAHSLVPVDNAELKQRLSRTLSQWRDSVLADNRRALDEAATAGRSRSKPPAAPTDGREGPPARERLRQ